MSLDCDFCNETNPGDDFYMWINRRWCEKNKIPDDEQRWGNFNILDQDNKKNIKKILEGEYDIDNIYSKFSILYKQGLESQNNKDKIYKFIKKIQKTKTIEELFKLYVLYHCKYGIYGPLNFSVYNDMNDATRNILHLSSGGIGLPDRDYYFLKDKEKQRQEYKLFLCKIADYFEIELNIDSIYNIEEELAKVIHTKVQKRQPELINNPRTLEEINCDYSNLSFINYFFRIIYKEAELINVHNPNYLRRLDELLLEISLERWQEYFILHFILSVKDYISEDFNEIVFDFYEKQLGGTPSIKPLWKRSLENTEEHLGELIGQCYVTKHFNEKSKKDALLMIEYIKEELKIRINSLEWMERKTKDMALEKLKKINVKIGYPDKWRDYSGYDIKQEYNYFKNNLLCIQAEKRYNFSKLYMPMDRSEWFMNPQTVNAYYSPSFNEIVFPAGILQPPFFSDKYDMALNFGGIGVIIGHEFTHGFDDQGCKFDGDGNLKNWWTPSDLNNYKLKTQVLKKQFDNYEIEGCKVNGELTLGENIADLGGITISYGAFKKYLLENSNENMDNLTPNQRFFINYGRVWRNNSRKEAIQKNILTDPHSPPIFRVNGIVKNVTDFYDIFNIKKTDLLYLDELLRASIW